MVQNTPANIRNISQMGVVPKTSSISGHLFKNLGLKTVATNEIKPDKTKIMVTINGNAEPSAAIKPFESTPITIVCLPS